MLIHIEAVNLILNKKQINWEKERLALDEMINYAATHKESLPNNYWQAEHRAYLEYKTALQILEAFIEAT